MAEEYSRSITYLELPTRQPLIATVEAGLIESHIGHLLGSGLDSLLGEDRLGDIGRLHNLCARVGALRALCAAFKAYLQRTGAGIVMDEERDAEMISLLLQLKSRMDRMVEEAFGGSSAFANALKEGFERFINQRSNRPAELLAKHMDSVLKGGSKAAIAGREDDLESTLDAALVIFRFIQVSSDALCSLVTVLSTFYKMPNVPRGECNYFISTCLYVLFVY